MKKLETIIIVIVFIVVLILSFSFTYEKGKEIGAEEYKSPLESVTILNNKIKLEENKRTYNAIVDCSNYGSYAELIQYKLSDKSYNATVNTTFYNDENYYSNYSEATDYFEIYLSLSNDQQEIVYRFNLTCGV